MNRLARPLGPDDLVMSHFTLGRHHPIVDRVAAAAAGGFAGIGLYALDMLRLRAEGFDDAMLADLLDEHDVSLSELEVVKGWAGGPDSEVGAQIEAAAYQLADRFGSRSLQAIGSYEGDMAEAGAAYAALCDRAADHGLAVALEPLPYTNIPDLPTALEVVERAGRPNGGLCIDIWHHTRAGDDRSLLPRLDPALIASVQMNDGPKQARTDDLSLYKDDCLRNRVAPGDGEMDAVGFVAALLSAGTTVPWSVEVCDMSVWDTDGIDHARRCGEAMRSVLAEAKLAAG